MFRVPPLIVAPVTSASVGVTQDPVNTCPIDGTDIDGGTLFVTVKGREIF
jgi:hypothetical protein